MSDHYLYRQYVVTPNPTSFEVVFTNRISGAELKMSIPLTGTLANQNQIDQPKVEQFAEDMLQLVRKHLDHHP